jgi:hypothetical protein
MHRVSDFIANYSNLGAYKMAKEQQAFEPRMDWSIGDYHRSLGIAVILYWTKQSI